MSPRKLDRVALPTVRRGTRRASSCPPGRKVLSLTALLAAACGPGHDDDADADGADAGGDAARAVALDLVL